MQLHFVKMEGAGNDYVYMASWENPVEPEDRPDLARMVSDRHFGIGSDGLIFINRGQKAEYEMEMYNADGSRSQMCGNGIRCVGKFLIDRGLVDKKRFTVESFGSVKTLSEVRREGDISYLRVDMGTPVFAAAEIPVDNGMEEVLDAPITVNGKEYRCTCVSVGNPHCIVVVDDTASLDLPAIGPFFENHPWFPERINTEFVQILDESHVRMRVWERGSGETLACGTGCTALTAGLGRIGKIGRTAEVEVLGGKLLIEWDEKSGQLYMTGPARTVFTGEIDWQE